MLEYEKYVEYKKIITRNELQTDVTEISGSQNEIEVVEVIDKVKSLSEKNKARNYQLRRQLLKKRVGEWSKSLTAHGLPNIFATKRFTIKILWSLALIASTSYCILNISREIAKYLKYEYTTHLENINEIPSPFPAITVCNINPLITKEAEYLVESIFKSTYGINLRQNVTESSHEFIEKLEHANDKARLHAFIPEYGDERRRLLGYSLDETLIECYFNNHACNPSDFTWMYSLDFGNCYQFNTGFNAVTGEKEPIEESYMPGSRSGLRLMFFLGESKNRYTDMWKAGLKLFVHSQEMKPSKFEGINVKAATSTNIGLRRAYEIKLPFPYTSCVDLTGIKRIFNYMGAFINY
jgi:hypothetical protein